MVRRFLRSAPLVTLWLLVLAAPAASQTLLSEEGLFRLSAAEDIVVQEEEPLITNVMDLEPDKNGGFFLTVQSPSHVLHVSEDGQDVRIIGAEGEGPGEYLSPHFARLLGDTLLVQSGLGGRHPLFHVSSGEPASTHVRFPIGVHDVTFANGAPVLYYSGQGEGEPFLVTYDFADGSTTVLDDMPTSPEHDVLMVYTGSGGLAGRGAHVFYATPDEAEVHRLDLATGERVTVTIPDEDFSVEPAPSGLLNDWPATIGYITGNSRVCGLFALDEYLVVQVEHGPAEGERMFKWHVLSYDMEHLDTIVMDVEQRRALGRDENQGRFLAGRGNRLYTVRTVGASAGDFQWTIWPWSLERVEG